LKEVSAGSPKLCLTLLRFATPSWSPENSTWEMNGLFRFRLGRTSLLRILRSELPSPPRRFIGLVEPCPLNSCGLGLCRRFRFFLQPARLSSPSSEASFFCCAVPAPPLTYSAMTVCFADPRSADVCESRWAVVSSIFHLRCLGCILEDAFCFQFGTPLWHFGLDHCLGLGAGCCF